MVTKIARNYANVHLFLIHSPKVDERGGAQAFLHPWRNGIIIKWYFTWLSIGLVVIHPLVHIAPAIINAVKHADLIFVGVCVFRGTANHLKAETIEGEQNKLIERLREPKGREREQSRPMSFLFKVSSHFRRNGPHALDGAQKWMQNCEIEWINEDTWVSWSQ